MTIPSAADFDDWLGRANSAVELPSAPAPDDRLSEADALAFIRRAIEARAEIYRELRAMPAMRWIQASREFQRADGIVHSRRRRGRRPEQVEHPPESADKLCAEIYHDAIEASRKYPNLPANWQLTTRLARPPFPPYAWIYRTVFNIREYLHSDTGDAVSEAAREISKAAEEAARAAERYWRIAEAVDALGVMLPNWRSRRAAMDHRTVGSIFPVPPKEAFPFARRDDRNAERLFVYRAAITNQSSVRKPKPEAIVELMGMEGFRHQYDIRTVERLATEYLEHHRQMRSRG